LQTGTTVSQPWWHIIDVSEEDLWLVASEIKLNYHRLLSKATLIRIEEKGCKLDTERERVNSRFDRVKVAVPEE